jgi:hypothetical protein
MTLVVVECEVDYLESRHSKFLHTYCRDFCNVVAIQFFVQMVVRLNMARDLAVRFFRCFVRLAAVCGGQDTTASCGGPLASV